MDQPCQFVISDGAVPLQDLDPLDEDHCRALGDFSRPGLEITLKRCRVTGAAATVLAQVLGRNQGPTKLDLGDIDHSVFADGLRGNSRLKSFTPSISSIDEDGKREALAILGALRENKGLVQLHLARFMDSTRALRMGDETWGAICDSVKTHPTLEVLDFGVAYNDERTTAAFIGSRIQALLDVLKVNLSIHTIHLNRYYSQHKLFRGSVLPYLETNRLRPRLLAIQGTRPITYRSKVLGRALLSARTNANIFWMLLSGNAEVTFPSRTTTIAAAAATTAAVTSTVNAAAVAASVVSASTTIATNSLPTAVTDATLFTASDSDAFAPTVAAATNIATPSARQKRNSARQKRKAHP
jgi:hypothetical protein